MLDATIPALQPALGSAASATRRNRAALLLAVVTLGAPLVLDGFSLLLARQIAITIIAVAALNILTGIAGQFSVGNAALMAVGAFGAVFATTGMNWPAATAFLVAAVLGAVVGLFVGLPALRLSGIYLIISTLAAHFIVVFVVRSYQIRVGSVAGVRIPDFSIGPFTFSTPREVYYLTATFMLVALYTLWSLTRSSYGRALKASSDHELVAAATGVNVRRLRVSIWVLTSVVVSVAGALQAFSVGFVTVERFTLELAISHIAMIIIGGLGSLTGAVLGVVILSLIPEFLGWITEVTLDVAPAIGTALGSHAAELERILYGLVIVLFVMFRPGGMVGMFSLFGNSSDESPSAAAQESA